MQSITVYIILVLAISYAIYAIARGIRRRGNPCSGCSGCNMKATDMARRKP